MKHATEGNRHVPDTEVEAYRLQGWVQWPRSISEKQGWDTPLSETVTPEIVAEPVVEKRKPGRPKKK